MNTDSIKKIIFVTISMTGGGTERVIATLSNYWIKNGKKVSILMIGGDDIAYELDEKIEVKSLSGATGGNLPARLSRITKLRQEFKENKDSVIIAMGTVASMFTAVAHCGLKNPLLVSERNDPNRLNHRPIKSYERTLRNILYRKSKRVVFQTQMARECFPESIKKKSCLIPNPLEDIPDTMEYIKRDKKVISAGRLTEQKNHKLLIDAFSTVHDRFDDYELVIYGEGEYKNVLKEYIEKKEASEFIKLAGFSDRLRDILGMTRIYVSSSDWEGISNSLAEAMACGMAVIATDCPMGGSAMLIDDGVNGRLVPVSDLKSMTQALEAFLSDDDIAAKCSTNARCVREDMEVSRIAKMWENAAVD